jgi:putative membrane protein
MEPPTASEPQPQPVNDSGGRPTPPIKITEHELVPREKRTHAAWEPMSADDSARLRNLLANNRTLLAYIRTSLAFAGIGFAVAKFGLTPKTPISGYLGILMVLVGLLVAIIGFTQHRNVLREEGPPPGAAVSSPASHVAAAIGCTLVCALLVIYLAVNTA